GEAVLAASDARGDRDLVGDDGLANQVAKQLLKTRRFEERIGGRLAGRPYEAALVLDEPGGGAPALVARTSDRSIGSRVAGEEGLLDGFGKVGVVTLLVIESADGHAED